MFHSSRALGQLTSNIHFSLLQGVYARVSGAAAWIKATSCALGSRASWCRNRIKIETENHATSDRSFRHHSRKHLESRPPQKLSAADSDSPVVTAVVAVQYDAHPEELGWSLIDSRTGIVKASFPFNSYLEPYKLLLGTIDLERGREYTLIMKDFFEDGFCCREGNGYIEIKINSTSMVNFWGDIGEQWTHNFTVPL